MACFWEHVSLLPAFGSFRLYWTWKIDQNLKFGHVLHEFHRGSIHFTSATYPGLVIVLLDNSVLGRVAFGFEGVALVTHGMFWGLMAGCWAYVNHLESILSCGYICRHIVGSQVLGDFFCACMHGEIAGSFHQLCFGLNMFFLWLFLVPGPSTLFGVFPMARNPRYQLQMFLSLKLPSPKRFFFKPKNPWQLEAMGCELGKSPDFVMLAKAYGGDGIQAR